MCTVRRAGTIIAALWLFVIIYNIPWLFLTELKPAPYDDLKNGLMCDFKISRKSAFYKGIFVLDFVAFYIVPLIMCLFVYGAICIKLSQSLDMVGSRTGSLSGVGGEQNLHSTVGRSIPGKSRWKDSTTEKSPENLQKDSGRTQNPKTSADSRNKRMRTTSVETKSVGAELVAAHERTPLSSSNSYQSISTSSITRVHADGRATRRTAARQIVKMLAVVVVIFAACWLPYRSLLLYNSFAKMTWAPPRFIFFSKTLVFINCAINPILYNVMSARFRDAFLQLLKNGRKRNPRSRSTSRTRQHANNRVGRPLLVVTCSYRSRRPSSVNDSDRPIRNSSKEMENNNDEYFHNMA